MRKVTFYIDDCEYFTRELKKNTDLSSAERKDIIDSLSSSFQAEYTLYGNGEDIERYELVSPYGDKIMLNDLNGYQKGCILGECKQYFENPVKYPEPCGVIDIKEISI